MTAGTAQFNSERALSFYNLPFAVMSGIDAELRGSIATLRALAASANLEKGELAVFHSEAARILKAGRRRIYGTAECHNRAGRLFTHHTVTYVRAD